jgi:hypothetical protein
MHASAQSLDFLELVKNYSFLIPHSLAVGIPQVSSPHLWERVRVRGLNLAYSFFIPRSLAAG